MALTAEQKRAAIAKLSSGAAIEPTNPTAVSPEQVGLLRNQMKSGSFTKDIKGIGTGIAESFGRRTQKVGEIKETKAGPVRRLFQTLGQSAGLLGDVVGETVLGGVKALTPEAIQKPVGEAVTAGAEAVVESEPIQRMVQNYQNLPPEVQKDIDAALGFGNLALELTGLGVAGKVSKAGVKATQKAVKTGITKTKPLVAKGVARGKELVGKKPTDLAETISPKITAKETRNIVRQGRVTQPKSSIIFGKRADVVSPTERMQKTASLIEKKIPKASTLDQYVLANKIGTLTTRTARRLKPELKGIQVTPEQTTRILDSWEKIKLQQAQSPEFVAFAGAKKAQSNFETFLQQVKARVRSTGGQIRRKDLNDLWEIRKSYDKSISESVKRATSQSAPSTQLQHDMWLQNREILNEIVEEMSENLPTTARGAFEEMNLFYEARGNLINKAKIDVKGKPGLFSTKNIIKGLLTGTAAKFLLFD
jgi:hypothetical protein